MDADLLRPTINEDLVLRESPWRLRSQLVVAFVGGTFALTWIATRNAQRLRMSESERARILWLGLGLGVLGSIAAGCILAQQGYQLGAPLDPELKDLQRLLRNGQRAVALVLFLLFQRWQTPAARRHVALAGPEAWSSLWGPGIVAIILSWLATGALAILGIVLGGGRS